jgi:hypothetical protein
MQPIDETTTPIRTRLLSDVEVDRARARHVVGGSININTNQNGRTFQDRSYVFRR